MYVYHYVCVPKCIYTFACIYVHVYCVYKKGCATMHVCHYVCVPLCMCATMHIHICWHICACILCIYTVLCHSPLLLSPSFFLSLFHTHTHPYIYLGANY